MVAPWRMVTSWIRAFGSTHDLTARIEIRVQNLSNERLKRSSQVRQVAPMENAVACAV
eukprot:CAMPEP_0119523418 /NCGR_PEP_ID=MMETSP1344-20130328/38483_1 /TAXON_ID=236787 /ORGANISM="Florenciella parvula, Strain CCMP2471" /LENGTH=57 /DNA_ID=CAMNT_0007561629 /DNA_START=288 /DNA_END=458 /DNA_ORIENTATION=+